MNGVIIPVVVLGVMGILFAIILSFASRVFYVAVDKRVEAVRTALPGANCGACGFPGCDGLAEAMVKDEASVNACPVGGEITAQRIAELLGKIAGDMDKEVAVVLCQGSNELAKNKFEYTGVQDCRINQSVQGGSKICPAGCLGCGTCVDVCAFDAIHIIDGVAVVDKDKCTACGLCIDICPRDLIELVPYDQEVMVKCKSHEKGGSVRKACSVGCIGCNICVKQCPDGFEVKKFLSVFKPGEDIDKEQLQNAIEKCPTKCIYPGLEMKKEMDAKKAAEKESKKEETVVS